MPPFSTPVAMVEPGGFEPPCHSLHGHADAQPCPRHRRGSAHAQVIGGGGPKSPAPLTLPFFGLVVWCPGLSGRIGRGGVWGARRPPLLSRGVAFSEPTTPAVPPSLTLRPSPSRRWTRQGPILARSGEQPHGRAADLLGGGGRTRTGDLGVMSLTRYQLRHPATPAARPAVSKGLLTGRRTICQ